jgi:hypothetical protein
MKLIETPYRMNSYVPETEKSSKLRTLGYSLLVAGSMLIPPAAIATSTAACGASQGQIADTVIAGEQLATCILADVLGGVTDPLLVVQKCAGAVPAVIADVIADFETKQVAVQSEIAADAGPEGDAGQPTLRALSLRKLSDREKTLLDEAKKNAVALVVAAHKK